MLLKQMGKQFSFSEKEMNGIVEDTYKNIINECKNLIRETKCPDEQIIALLSLDKVNCFPTANDFSPSKLRLGPCNIKIFVIVALNFL